MNSLILPGLETRLSGPMLDREFVYGDTTGTRLYTMGYMVESSNRAEAILHYMGAIPFLEADFEAAKDIRDQLTIAAMLRASYIKILSEKINEGMIPTIESQHDARYYNKKIDELDVFLIKNDIRLITKI